MARKLKKRQRKLELKRLTRMMQGQDEAAEDEGEGENVDVSDSSDSSTDSTDFPDSDVSDSEQIDIDQKAVAAEIFGHVDSAIQP